MVKGTCVITEKTPQAAELNNLRLSFGDVLQLQFKDASERFRVRLIGYLEGRSMIITVPVHNGRLLPVRPGQSLTVRMMVNGRACAFVSEILHVNRMPYPYIHLRYPDDLITNSIRKAVRVETRVDGQLVNLSIGERAKEIPCYLLDISETGAHLVTPVRIGKSGDEIALTLSLNISGIERTLSVPSILRGRLKVRSKTEDGGVDTKEDREVHYGIEFKPLADDDRIALIAFVYSRLSV